MSLDDERPWEMKTADQQNRSTFDIGAIVQQISSQQVAAIRADADRDLLALILKVYDGCKDDPQARIPQRLSLAIEGARRGCMGQTREAE